jgi:hypothetical protein
MSSRSAALPLSASLAGRTFVHPLFDYMLIGGGLSLLVAAIVVVSPAGSRLLAPGPMLYIILLSNAAHFAASTVRLYSKPGAVEASPFLAKAVPWLAIVVMTLCVVFVGRVGGVLEAFYLTWSPYHYAAQAYGLAVIYSYRSGCNLGATDKRLLWWASMVPFFYMALHLFGQRLPEPVFAALPGLAGQMGAAKKLLVLLGLAGPVLLFARIWRSASGPMPLISLLTLLTNAIWFFVLDPLEAFLWATVFHGIQYLAIVLIFDVREQMARPGNAYGRWFHTFWFYGLSVALGCVLFLLLPKGYEAIGFDYQDSRLVSVAIINIHHFIVDAYIWRLSRGDANRKVVDGVY